MNSLKLAGGLFVALSFGVGAASAQSTVTWIGGDGDYGTAANWSTNSVPDTANGDTALITSGNVTYDAAGGDFLLNNGGTLEISGGSWTQTDGINWIQPGNGGTILVNGGTFNMGTSANINGDATSTFTVSAGTANLSGPLVYNPSTLGAFNLSGTGVVNVGGEFDPNTVFAMSGGTLNITTGVSFSNSSTSGINFSGGTITLDGTWNADGFYAASQANGLNFTSGSTGTLFLSGVTAASITGGTLLTDGAITYDGTIDSSEFIVTDGTNDGVSGAYITTVAAIPEPAAYAALLGAAALGLVALRRRRNG